MVRLNRNTEIHMVLPISWLQQRLSADGRTIVVGNSVEGAGIVRVYQFVVKAEAVNDSLTLDATR